MSERKPTRSELAAAIIAWRRRWQWHNGRWPTENDRIRATKKLEAVADALIEEQDSDE